MTWFEAASKSGVCSRARRLPGLAVLASVLVLLFGSRPASAQAPADNPHGKLDLPCATCHSSDGWTPAKIDRSFNHSSFGFVLADGHGAVACRTCHTSLEFSKVATTCASCHKDVHQGELGLDCAQCHNTRAFGDRATQVQSHALTRFPLDGAHRTVDCASCHTTRNGSGSLVFRGAPTDCVACHRDTFERTTNPSHPAAGFPTDCASCHTNVSWQTATFDHNLTKFALTGAHQAVRCESCHQNGVYQSLSTDCVACHQPNFDQTSTPPHAAAHFPTECATCHTTTTWQGAPFDHNTTQFPLDGAHQAVTCQECHGDGQYVGKPTACLSCHQASFDQTKTPPHHDAGFPTDCTSCHTTSAWAGAAFDHNTTKFPLSGAHQAARCQDCHVDGVYVGKSTTCVSCHQSDYNATTTPNHQATGFPTECTTCHTTVTWTGARFDHNTTHFPLTGGHAAVACASCHGDGVFAGKPTTCVTCHQDNYGRTTNPPHQASGFPTDCATCHTTTNWVGAPFDHNKTQFPLTGAHQAATCQNCHADGVYAGRPTTCVSCHQPNYDRTSNPVHRTAGFSTNCSSCHNVNTWAGAVFDHNQTQFPLTGAHLAATCQTCHADGVYGGKPTTCVSCHQARFDGTRDPDHRAAQFPSDCSLCHTTAAWEPSPFNHSATQFPLTGAHTAATCQSCHGDGVYRGKPTACVACHQPNYDGTTNPKHREAGFSTNCSSCHNTNAWPGAVFNHGNTRFPLAGAHAAATCQACHGDGIYAGKPTTCVSCHQASFDGTTNPDHRAAQFPTDCVLCHSQAAWRPSPFNHATTDFPLTGAHVAATCQSCHADGVYDGKPTTCVSCHQTDYNGTTDPNHQAARFSTTCTTCHTTATWTGATFNHGTTRFPLRGAHAAVTCQACHGDGIYAGKPTTCVSCHQADYNGVTSPNHQTARFPTTCADCHTENVWKPSTFNHGSTDFPLTGAHVAATCQACHGDGVYAGKPTTCVSCHRTEYDGTTTPRHSSAGFSTTCSTCHTTTQWAGAVFDHGNTRFPLTGAHSAVVCNDCHGDGVYAGKPTTCVSCHQTDYNGVVTPSHTAAKFPTTCTDCHTNVAWKPSTFNHATTSFPLTGAHVAANCQACHGDGVYRGKPTTCVSCHQTDFNGTTNPNHQQAGFSTTCTTCHTTTRWTGASFDHSKTAFPLLGAHVAATCQACHGDGVYAGKPTTCVSCHRTDYDGAATPNHVAAKFPTTCADCHGNAAWKPSTFNHATTSFPLTGAHQAVTCAQCHGDGVYDGKPTTCVSCHQTDYTGTTNPPHLSAGFPTTCTTCHTTTAWLGATFNHSTTKFPLTGAHVAATCQACHGDGVYAGKPTTCVSCHRTDYDGVTDPNHKTAGFPTSCTDCHTTTRWTGATFDHDSRYFRIYSGKHRNRWSTCSTCHTNPASFGEFTCLTCHEHNKSSMDSEHRGRSGYSYTSTACLSCHPRV